MEIKGNCQKHFQSRLRTSTQPSVVDAVQTTFARFVCQTHRVSNRLRVMGAVESIARGIQENVQNSPSSCFPSTAAEGTDEEMQGGTFPIFDLPADHLVTDHIVKYLGVQGIFNLWSCSGDYTRLAERLLTRLDLLDLARLSERCSDAFWLAIKENCCRLKRIDLHRYVVLGETFFDILNNNPLLEELDISYCSIAAGEWEIRPLENLRRLKMSESQPTLSFLRVIAEGSKRLWSVDLSWITSLNSSTLADFFQRLPQLREINVSGTKVDGEEITLHCGLIAKGCPNLEVLRVDILQCRFRSLHEPHSLLEVVKHCHKLNHIIFHTKFIPSDQYKARFKETIGKEIKVSYTHGRILTTYAYDEHLALVETLY